MALYGGEWNAASDSGIQSPLVTRLGVVAGEVLTHLDEQGPTSLRVLNQTMPRSSRLVLMAVGSLIREGLIAARLQDVEIVLSPIRRESRSAGMEPALAVQPGQSRFENGYGGA